MVSHQEIKNRPSSAIKLAVDVNIFGNNSTPIETHIESILSWCEDKFGSTEIIQAKEDFYAQTGKIFPEDECFNHRMSYFIDFFIFERSINKIGKFNGLTPFSAYLKFQADDTIKQAHHSLYEIKRHSVREIVIQDLISKETFRIHNTANHSFEGMQKRDLFQGFIYHTVSELTLSKGLVFHTHQAHRVIKKLLKDCQKIGQFQREKFLATLAHLQLSQVRHAHIPAGKYYDKQISLGKFEALSPTS